MNGRHDDAEWLLEQAENCTKDDELAAALEEQMGSPRYRGCVAVDLKDPIRFFDRYPPCGV